MLGHDEMIFWENQGSRKQAALLAKLITPQQVAAQMERDTAEAYRLKAERVRIAKLECALRKARKTLLEANDQALPQGGAKKGNDEH